ncbi:MAG TPA: hypothetical protein PLJ50_08910, partial [Candidatus Latescibacteria bacterium]|nr:hypothetical protein [Candidatus Latescibacterota bacterium]
MKEIEVMQTPEPRPLSRPRPKQPAEQPAKASDIIDEAHIEGLLSSSRSADKSEIREILDRAKELHGLTHEEVARLLMVEDPDLLAEMGHAARW